LEDLGQRFHPPLTDRATFGAPLMFNLLLNRFGTVTSCDIIRDFKTGDSLSYGFIGEWGLGGGVGGWGCAGLRVG